MKFTIRRNIFMSALSVVQRAISSQTTIPILTGVKILVMEDGILLTGSDSTISIERFLSVEDKENDLIIAETGSIVLTASFFSEIVRRLPEETFTLSVEGEQTTITSGSSVFNLNGVNGSEYPKISEMESKQSFTLPARVLKSLISHTIISVSNQEIRPLFTGVHFELTRNELKAVSTDAHRLSQRILSLDDLDIQIEEPMRLNVPGRSLQELSRIMEDNDNITVSFEPSQVLFQDGDTSLYSRLIEGEYPDTDRLIPRSSTTSIQLEASTLLSAVERAMIMSHRGRANIVQLHMEEGNVVLSSRSAEVGHVEETLAVADFEGEVLDISFNPDYMKQALQTFGHRDILVRFQSATQPFLVLPVEDSETLERIQLITPIRTPNTR